VTDSHEKRQRAEDQAHGPDGSTGPRLRTSLSHPIRIDEVTAGDAGGLIGITFCPGKRDGSRWARNLSADLDIIARWQPKAIVTLIEDHEFTMLGVPELGAEVRARGIDWHHLPIVDVQVPDERFESGWMSSGPTLCRSLRDGGKVLVHCRGGLGRAGTVAALLLIELGELPHDAVRKVRAARPGAIETADQLQYVLDFPRRMRTLS